MTLSPCPYDPIKGLVHWVDHLAPHGGLPAPRYCIKYSYFIAYNSVSLGNIYHILPCAQGSGLS